MFAFYKFVMISQRFIMSIVNLLYNTAFLLAATIDFNRFLSFFTLPNLLLRLLSYCFQTISKGEENFNLFATINYSLIKKKMIKKMNKKVTNILLQVAKKQVESFAAVDS